MEIYSGIIVVNTKKKKKKKNELEKIQNEVARITTGATKLVSLNALHNEIQWESLEERRKKNINWLYFIK